jgi:hypothetical protein
VPRFARLLLWLRLPSTRPGFSLATGLTDPSPCSALTDLPCSLPVGCLRAHIRLGLCSFFAVSSLLSPCLHHGRASELRASSRSCFCASYFLSGCRLGSRGGSRTLYFLSGPRLGSRGGSRTLGLQHYYSTIVSATMLIDARFDRGQLCVRSQDPFFLKMKRT